MSEMKTLLTPTRRRRWPLLLGLAVITGAGGFYFFGGSSSQTQISYTTSNAATGNLSVSVAASGTLEPTNLVTVGSELSGIVEAVLVDENDTVTKGQEIARLDTAKLKDSITKSEAALASAQADVKQAEASLKEAAAALARQQELQRLTKGRLPAKADMDTAEATAARAEASVAQAKAAVAQAEATLSSDRTNLEKASIRSPIDGVVLSREIEPGQTVAASLQAPTLFEIAEDLKQMELQVNIDEADVGQVKEGQSATFTVDAWPGRRYPASISRVSYGSTITDNVVTYLGKLTVDNSDLSLRPGMTASATISTLTRENVLLIPNTALRYTPPATVTQKSGSFVSSLMPRMPAMGQRRRSSDDADSTRKTIYVLEQGQPKAVEVTIGASDGRQSEVTAGDLKEGMSVITGSKQGT